MSLAGFALTGGASWDLADANNAVLLGLTLEITALPGLWPLPNLIPGITPMARRFHGTDSNAALLFAWIIAVASLVVTIIHRLTPSDPRGVRFDPLAPPCACRPSGLKWYP